MKNTKAILLAVSILTVAASKAQFGGNGGTPGGGGTGGGFPTTGGGPVVPFDGGMSLAFAAAGVGYIQKQLQNKKAKETKLA